MTIKHAMLDIETLDTVPTGVVASIGCVKFVPSKPQDFVVSEFYERLNINRQIRTGRTISGETVSWWMEQEASVQRATFVNGIEREPIDVITELSEFLADVEGGIWGYGAGFDNVFIQSLARSLGVPAVWPYMHDRCFRTLVKLFDPDGEYKPKTANEQAHNALWDARWQTERFMNMVNGNHVLKNLV